MGQHHPIDRRWINGRVVPVSLLELVRTLKQTAVHQQSLTFRFHQIFRACDGAGCAEKSDFRHGARILSRYSQKSFAILQQAPDPLVYPRPTCALTAERLTGSRTCLTLTDSSSTAQPARPHEDF